jgi:hypothetical protein
MFKFIPSLGRYISLITEELYVSPIWVLTPNTAPEDSDGFWAALLVLRLDSEKSNPYFHSGRLERHSKLNITSSLTAGSE